MRTQCFSTVALKFQPIAEMTFQGHTYGHWRTMLSNRKRTVYINARYVASFTFQCHAIIQGGT